MVQIKRCSHVFFVFLLFLFLSCSEEEKDHSVRLALQTEPTTLDPVYSVDYSSGLLSSLIHSNLLRFDVDGRIVGDLAVRWTVDSSGTIYRFVLSPASFSTGKRVSAYDVLYSFRRLLSPQTHSPRWWVLKQLLGARDFHSGTSSNLPGLRAEGDSVVVLELGKPLAHFPALLAMPACGIVNRDEVERLGRDYGRMPAGSGPWMLERWSEGDEIRLKRNPFYKGRPPRVEHLRFRIIPESMTRIAEYEAGNLDLLEIPRAELARWKSSNETVSAEELRIVYIGLNNSRPPFDDPRVRRALNEAIDVGSIIDHVLFGAARRAEGLVPPALRSGFEPPGSYRFDPSKAKMLLKQAGYPKGFKMQIWQRENPESGRVLESVQGYLARVGVKVEIVTREWGAFKQAVDNGVPDAFYLDWFADYPDAENFLFPLFHSSNIGGGGNRARYSNPAVDSLLELASACLDPSSRARAYFEAERIIYNDAPWIFLWFPLKFEAVSPRLKGYTIPLIFNGQRFLDVSLD